MSSSTPSPNPNVSSSQFQDLFNAALEEYSQKTGKEITTDPITTQLRDCNSSGAVLNVLEEQFHSIDHFRRGDADQEVQLMRRLKPIIDILFGLSNGLVFREGIGLVRLTRFELVCICISSTLVIHSAGSFPNKSNICQCWPPTRSMCLLLALPVFAVLTLKFQRRPSKLAPVMMRSSNFLKTSIISSAFSKSSLRFPPLWESFRSK